MKVFPSDHIIFMNEDSIEIPRTVKANYIADELTARGDLGGITQFSETVSAH